MSGLGSEEERGCRLAYIFQSDWMGSFVSGISGRFVECYSGWKCKSDVFEVAERTQIYSVEFLVSRDYDSDCKYFQKERNYQKQVP